MLRTRIVEIEKNPTIDAPAKERALRKRQKAIDELEQLIPAKLDK